MQTNAFLRAFAALVAAGGLAACSSADNPYASIEDPPLLKATLHTLTFQVADASAIQDHGFTRLPPGTNYPGAARVEAALWKVPEEVAAAPIVLAAPAGQGVHERYLVMPPSAPVAPAAEQDSRVIRDFYERVLGSAVPSGSGSEPAGARLHSVMYMVDYVVAAKNKLREAAIPVTFSPVAITTAYLGDHKLLGITAPDGIIIELVEAAAH
jgi:hypothetical protein